MVNLSQCFEVSSHKVISIIGSGGKSSLIKYLAKSFSHERVLISTTTKMLYPKEGEADFLWINKTYENEGEIRTGVTIAGDKVLGDDVLKLQLPNNPNFLSSMLKFDKVLLEADGSKGLPLKGWADFEPVILPETTMTIGVLPITAIGKPITKDYIHRLPLWLEFTGAKEGSLISEENLKDTITNEKGLWAKAKGDKILYISQVEDGEELKTAKKVVELLPVQCRGQLKAIVAGSVMTEVGEVLHEN
jgi:probable selenium-dependent hydroxylase accessory protein YqeC